MPSLASFASHAQRRLTLEILGVLALKLALLTILYFAFFAGPPVQPDLAAHVLGHAIQN